MKNLAPYSFGVGDRFAHQARAQLAAFQEAARHGVALSPVWNKSNREHTLIGSEPAGTRAAAEQAVAALGWTGPWHLDADHINLNTVDRFLAPCDFFTLDVADDIGKPATDEAVASFLDRHPELTRPLSIEGIATPFTLTREDATRMAKKFLLATCKAGDIYRHILAAKGPDFITEVSMDETDAPQTPPELLLILAALADQGIPVQTVAPKFTGRFNKGVDYVGDLAAFEREFNDDLAVIAHAVRAYGLPASLKLSVHSGSDKFSLYPVIRKALQRTGAGLHIKTAGTTWLEEVIGLAESGGNGLEIVREIYGQALTYKADLCGPYATVIDIDDARLPDAATVARWSSEEFVQAVRHDQRNPAFNPSVRQLLHVAFKLAAKKGETYLAALRENEKTIARCVTHNILERHIRPLFL